METIPFPAGALFDTGALSLIFGVSVKTIYNVLSEHRQSLDPPMYRQRRARLYRFVSGNDFEVLRTRFRVRVRR